jgi:hypothetical protein
VVTLALNNPSSLVLRDPGRGADHFQNGARGAYGGLATHRCYDCRWALTVRRREPRSGSGS